MLSTLSGLESVPFADDASSDFHAVIVAGDPNGNPTDSPNLRVDLNSADSPFAGVGSLQISTRRATYICTATPIDSTHVLTAGHCVDLNNDGVSDKRDGISSIYFQLNIDVDSPSDKVDISIKAANWVTNPNFTGFNRPSINDDLAIITLNTALPAGTPIYGLPSTDMSAGVTHLYMVGYGQSGDGVNGYTVSASFAIKRHGENMVDAFYGQDDAGQTAANEVFRFDFDGPSGNGSMGAGTLGNDRETTLGGGDSGGPSFALKDGADPNLASSYQLIGVNTFTQGISAPKFGSLGGGINLFPYLQWLTGGTSAPVAGAGSGAGGGNGATANSEDGVSNEVLWHDVEFVSSPPATRLDGLGSGDTPANPRPGFRSDVEHLERTTWDSRYVLVSVGSVAPHATLETSLSGRRLQTGAASDDLSHDKLFADFDTLLEA